MMQQIQTAVLLAPLESASQFTIRGSFTAGIRTVAHEQFLSSDYVATRFEGSTVIYCPKRAGRFVVDGAVGVLRPMNAFWGPEQKDHLRTVLGQILIERDDSACEIDGYRCRRHLLHNEGGRITIVAEAWCARLRGLEGTALRHERDFESRVHPFALALEPDELVVRSVMRTSANGTEQRQTYRLLAVEPGIDSSERFSTYLRFPIMER